MLAVGIDENDPLAIALRDALGQRAPAPAPPRAAAAPSSPPVQPRLRATGGSSSRTPTPPPRRAGTSTPALQRQASRANERPSGELLGRLADSGISTRRLHRALRSYLVDLLPLPPDILSALNRAGIETHIPEHIAIVSHPLFDLNRELNAQASARAQASSSGAQASGAATRDAIVLPERDDSESNLHYAWRVRSQNPGISLRDIANAVVRGRGGRAGDVMTDLRTQLDAYEAVNAKFSGLRPISRAYAEEHMQFKDAAIYNQDDEGPFSKDLATACMFGEDLSLSNPNQRVIGLATVRSSREQAFDPDVNKEIVFMDMNKLAEFLVNNPKHPHNNQPLNVNNIADYAFKIS
ncbi:hypothetical protein [Trinickia dinghuensis]|nr:hypothetical protein [Trinickia dinghuensis]